MTCLICRLPADMDTPVLGRLLYWHVNRVARHETREAHSGDSRDLAPRAAAKPDPVSCRVRLPDCRACAVLGRFQRGPAYWLLRLHMRRMAGDR